VAGKYTSRTGGWAFVGRTADLLTVLYLVGLAIAYFASKEARLLLSGSIALPVWLLLAVLALGLVSTVVLSRLGPRWSWSLMHAKDSPEERPRLVTATDPSSFRVIPSGVLNRPVGGLSLWLYVNEFGKGIRQLEGNRYLIAHSTSLGPVKIEGERWVYTDVFALSRGPAATKDSPPSWRVVLSDSNGKGAEWYFPDSADIDVGWHHFVLRWDHHQPLLEMLIDGEPKISRDDYRDFWPGRLVESVIVGCWLSPEWAVHFANTYFWKVQEHDRFPSDDWIKVELGSRPPTVTY
jgi:uncharacterized membrane protein YhdT